MAKRAKRYWLLKTEPGCFSVDDLATSKNQTTTWDGVRNYQARNLLRDDIKVGDSAFFYHSKSGDIGIAGICEIVNDGYHDHTALDSNEQHFDPKATRENPIWFMVDVRLKKKLSEIIPLAQLKQTAGLEGMVLCQRGSRLSVQPVTPQEWKIILKLAK